VTLRELLAGLPPGAMVPAGWVLEHLPAEPQGTSVPPGDLSVADVGRQLGRSTSTVRAWVEAGRFPGAYKLPGDPKHAAWRIPAGALEAFRQAATVALTPIDAPVRRFAPPRPTGETPDLSAWRRGRKQAAR